MSHRSKRQLKKLYRKWLDRVIDASMESYWRQRLFSSRTGEVFAICPEDTTGLHQDAIDAIVRFDLHFSVTVGQPGDAPAWLSENGNVIFVFWATPFPSVRSCTGNNPQVVFHIG